MTIHRNHFLDGEITFECDGCHETIETGESDWSNAQSQFQAEGWRAEKVGDESRFVGGRPRYPKRMHFCADCQSRGKPTGGLFP